MSLKELKISGTIEQEQEEDYYEPKGVKDFWNNNYIQYESMVTKIATYH